MSSPAKKPQASTKPTQGQTQISTAWQGPLPPPEAVQKFDTIVEGGAERIFRMAEKEQQHRIESETAALQVNVEATRAEIQATQRGSWMGFLVSVLAIGGAIYTVSASAHWSVSVALVSVPVMGAVRALITRR